MEITKIKQVPSAKKNYSADHGGVISHTLIKIAPEISSPLVSKPLTGDILPFISIPNSLCS
jgi:hypothetical protein